MASGDNKDNAHLLCPPVTWAQRNDKIFLTINLEDVEDQEIKLQANQLYFKGKGGTDRKKYEITMEFFKEVKPQESKYVVLPRNIPMVIVKKEDGPYWPRLLKESGKKHWLKTDFDKWRDEDDSDQDEKSDFQLGDMMNEMGNFNAGSPDDMALDDENDSDDEELPDLEDNTSKDKDSPSSEIKGNSEEAVKS